MKKFMFASLLLSLCVTTVVAQDAKTEEKPPVITVLNLQVGVRDRMTFRNVEVLQIRGRWIVPDMGYFDLGSPGEYREYYFGGGYYFFIKKELVDGELADKFAVTGELFYSQSQGIESRRAGYLQPMLGVYYTPHTSRLSGELEGLVYVPVNKKGTKQFFLDHAKVEYSFHPLFKVGVGYAAYKFGSVRLENQSFITTTFTPKDGKYGSFELYFQKLPTGKQLQFRYQLVHLGKKKK